MSEGPCEPRPLLEWRMPACVVEVENDPSVHTVSLAFWLLIPLCASSPRRSPSNVEFCFRSPPRRPLSSLKRSFNLQPFSLHHHPNSIHIPATPYTPFKLSSSLVELLCASKLIVTPAPRGHKHPNNHANPDLCSLAFARRARAQGVVLQPFPAGASRECVGADHRPGQVEQGEVGVALRFPCSSSLNDYRRQSTPSIVHPRPRSASSLLYRLTDHVAGSTSPFRTPL